MASNKYKPVARIIPAARRSWSIGPFNAGPIPAPILRALVASYAVQSVDTTG
jgi:hypothetical protein